MIVQKCIYLSNPAGDLVYDFTQVVNDKTSLMLIVEGFRQIIQRHNIDTVLGHGYGGTQLVGAIVATGLKVNGAVVRSEPHPTQKRQVEGHLNSASRVLIVDDAIYSGATIDKIKAAVTQAQWSKIVGISAIFDDWRPDGTRRIEQQYQIPVYPLFHRHDVGLTMDAVTSLPPSAYEDLLIQKSSVYSTKNLVLADYASANRSKHEMKSRPVFYGNLVINAVDNYTTTCYDTISKTVVWELKSPGGAPYVNAPDKGVVQELSISTDNFLYMAGYDGAVRKIEPTTGRIEWETKLDRYVHATPVYRDGRVYVNTESWFDDAKRGGGMTCAIDAMTGKLIWRYLHDDYCPSTVLVTVEGVYAHSNDGTFTCFTLDGELKWTATLDIEAKVPPLKVGDHVYVLDSWGWLYKFDMDGKRVWKVRASNQGWQVFPIYYQGLILVYSHNRAYIFGHNPDTGAREWISKVRSPVAGFEVLADDTLLVSSVDTQLAYYAGLTKVWELNDIAHSCVLASAAVVNSSRTLLAFNAQRGGFHIYSIA